MPVAGGGGTTPVPPSVTDCVPLGSLSVKVSVAERAPAAAGENVTLTVQLALTPSVFGLSGQLLFDEKSPPLAPPIATPVIVSGAVPVLVSVTVCAGLVVPTFWLANVRPLGVSVAVGPG